MRWSSHLATNHNHAWLVAAASSSTTSVRPWQVLALLHASIVQAPSHPISISIFIITRSFAPIDVACHKRQLRTALHRLNKPTDLEPSIPAICRQSRPVNTSTSKGRIVLHHRQWRLGTHARSSPLCSLEQYSLFAQLYEYMADPSYDTQIQYRHWRCRHSHRVRPGVVPLAKGRKPDVCCSNASYHYRTLPSLCLRRQIHPSCPLPSRQPVRPSIQSLDLRSRCITARISQKHGLPARQKHLHQ